MYGQDAFGVLPRAEGVPVSGVYYNRAESVISGAETGLMAGEGGVAIGRFGWAAPDGTVLNARTSAQDVQGIVAIQAGDWRRVFWDDVTGTWRIRKGMNMTMISGGPGMWIKLLNGGEWGQRIYADPTDGRPIAGFVEGLESSRWSVVSGVGPNGLSLITTWNTPNG